MNDRQRARLQSYRATAAVFERYPDEVAAVPALLRSIMFVRTRLAELSDAAEAQAGYVAQGTAKQALRDALAAAAVPIAQALAARADEAGDLADAALYDFSASDFLHDTEQDALDRAAIVLDGAQATPAEALAEYGASADDVAALDAALDAFREGLTTPRDAVAVRSAHTRAVERLVPLIGDHLRRRTDRMMARYRGTPFGDEYKTARTVVGD